MQSRLCEYVDTETSERCRAAHAQPLTRPVEVLGGAASGTRIGWFCPYHREEMLAEGWRPVVQEHQCPEPL